MPLETGFEINLSLSWYNREPLWAKLGLEKENDGSRIPVDSYQSKLKVLFGLKKQRSNGW